jgi:hypothetical protein
MASCGVLVKENDFYKIVLYNTQLGAACNSHSNKVLAILLYKKQLSHWSLYRL